MSIILACTSTPDFLPDSEWIRPTPIRVPTDWVWTAKDDARYISPVGATPGRHTVGVARSWRFLNVLTGDLFVIMRFESGQWRRFVPQSTLVLLQAWNSWVHYATFHLPPEFNGFITLRIMVTRSNNLALLPFFIVDMRGMGEDRRRHPRTLYFARTELVVCDSQRGEVLLSGMIEDKSESGLGVQLSRPIPLGTQVLIKVADKMVPAVVRRCIKGKFGSFIGVSFEADFQKIAPPTSVTGQEG